MTHARYTLASSLFLLAIAAPCFGATIDRQTQSNVQAPRGMQPSPSAGHARPANEILLAQATLPSLTEVNLLATDEGGQALVVPTNNWFKPISGNEKDYGQANIKEEAVYGFKDEKPAAFSKFSVLITGASNENPKQIELLVADDSPTGTFRSVAVLNLVNAKLVKSPYQEVVFDEVKARYVKIKILSGNGYNFVQLGQIRLLGRLLE